VIIMQSFKAILLSLFFFVIFTVCSTPFFAHARTDVPSERLFSITIIQQQLGSVVGDVEKKTGIKVKLDEELANIIVSGVFVDVTVDEFFRRAIKGKNIAVQYAEKESIVTVQTFLSSLMAASRGSDPKGSSSAGVTDEEHMRKMQAEQLAELKRWEKDPDALDPMSGVRRGDLMKLHEDQLAAFAKWQDDPNAKDPMTGKRRSDIQSMQTKQLAKLEAQQSNPATPDPVTGRPVGEMGKTRKEQLAAFEKDRNNPDAIDPMSGMRRGDIAALHKEQLGKLRNASN
jgi:hypothetical protein